MWSCSVVLQNKTWGWIPFVGVDKGVYWAPWKTDRRPLTDGERVTPTTGSQPGRGYYSNPLRIILRIKGWLDSLGLPRQGTWLGLCQPADERLVCSGVIWQLGCAQTALCCGGDLTPSLTACTYVNQWHSKEGGSGSNPLLGQAKSIEFLCVYVSVEKFKTIIKLKVRLLFIIFVLQQFQTMCGDRILLHRGRRLPCPLPHRLGALRG